MNAAVQGVHEAIARRNQNKNGDNASMMESDDDEEMVEDLTPKGTDNSKEPVTPTPIRRLTRRTEAAV